MMLKSILIAATMLASSGAAMANCYEQIGCDDSQYYSKNQMRQLSCDSLWLVRNGIYAQNGYCFKTQRGISTFGNGQCSVNDQARVSLNAYERDNVGVIVAVEKSKGCR
ncbi:YARHG domain-containing protein [Devosia sp.]|uniref:YARHG domain-containing protein n=1 Tax=Devosia sp. TaxID=1871048 RepID=UPI0032648BCF